MNTCSLKSITEEINQFLDSYKNGTQYADTLLSAIESKYGKNLQALLAIRSRLINEGLYPAEISNYVDSVSQCRTFNSSWNNSFLEKELLTSTDENKLFRSNFKGVEYVRSFITPKFIQAGIIDNRYVNIPITASSEDLQQKIIDLKNELCEIIYSTIRTIDSDFELDGNGHCFYENGADSEMYYKLISKAINVCEEFNIKKDSLKTFNFQEDPLVSNFISSILVLTNFDYYLDSILEDVIAPIKHKGYLHTSDYQRLVDYNSGSRDIMGVTDEEYDDASKQIAPDLELIIKSIPYIDINFEKGKLSVNRLNTTLTIPNILQFSHWLQLVLPKLSTYYLDLQNTDILADPISTLRETLKRIHGSLLNWNDTSSSNYPTPELKRLFKRHGNNINIAMSLYEYYFNDSKRLVPRTRSIEEIETQTIGSQNINPPMLILAIAQQLVSSVAPAYIEHNQNGSIVDETKLSGETPTISIENGYKQKALKNKQYFEVKSLVRQFLLKSILNSDFENTYKEELFKQSFADFSGSRSSKGKQFLIDLFSIDPDDFSNLKLLISEFTGGKTGTDTPIMKAIRSLYTNIIEAKKLLKNENYNLVELYEKIATYTDSFVKSIGDLEDFSNVLAPIFSQSPVPTFIDRNGNQIGVYRNTSLIFGLDHLISRYKSKIDEPISDLDYIPLRERTNIFVKAPQLLQQGDNVNYQSQIAIPLTLGTESNNTEARKQPEFVQDARQFLGEFLSLMCSQSYQKVTPMFAIQLGAYSDKMTLPEVVINALTSCLKISDKKSESITQLLNTDRLNTISYIFSSTNRLDLLNHIVSDLYTVFNYISNHVSEFNLSEEELNIIESIKQVLPTNSEDFTITKELLSTGSNSHSQLFKNVLESEDSKKHNTYLNSFVSLTNDLYNKLQNSVSAINSILKLISKLEKKDGYDAKENFIYNVLNRAATLCDIELVDKLHFDEYKPGLEMNRMMLQDVKRACTLQQSNGVNDQRYYQDLAEGALNKEYIIRGQKVTFLKYLSDTLKKNIKVYQVLFAQNIGHKLGFDLLYKQNGDVDEDKLKEIYTKYLTLTDFLRHQLLDLTVKEAYTDGKGVTSGYLASLEERIENLSKQLQETKSRKIKTELNSLLSELEKEKEELLIQERSGRQQASTKRNNTITATYKPFIGNTLFGINNLTKMCMIEDIKGRVFNQLFSQTPYSVTEFDGGAMTSPIQTRMEDFSLGKKQRTSIKKTFVTPISNYNAEELKWASDEMTNKLIRESQHCKIPLLEMFKRMHSIPFNYDITVTWDSEFPVHDLSAFLGKDYYTREGLDYVKYTAITSLGNNTYELTRELVDKHGNKIEDLPSKTVQINTIYGIYEALNGINCMSLQKSGELDYSESIMDLLYKFTTRVGEYTGDPDNFVLAQDKFYLPLRESFIGILATHSSNKRGAGNLTSGKAWANKNIPLNYYSIDLTTGGEQLDATHAADRSEITKGTQMLQSLAQKGYDENLVMQIYSGLSAYMEHSSELFTIASNLINEGKVQELQDLLTTQISKDLEFGETSLELRTMLECLSEDAERKGESLELPLSLVLKEVINSIAPDVNKQVIKQKDSGLMGTLGFSSGFVQRYQIKGTSFNNTTLLSKQALENWSKYREVLNSAVEQIKTRIPDFTIEDLITNLEISKLNMGQENFDRIKEILNQLTLSNLQTLILNDSLSEEDKLLCQQLIDLGFNDNPSYNLFLLVSDQSKSGLLLLKNLRRFINSHDGEIGKSFLTLEQIDPTQVTPGEFVLVGDQIIEITSNKAISDIINSGQEVYSIKSYPVDLMPNVLQIVTESGYSENQYTSRGTVFNQQIADIQEFKSWMQKEIKKNTSVSIIDSIINGDISEFTKTLIKNKEITSEQADYILNNVNLVKSVNEILNIADNTNIISYFSNEIDDQEFIQKLQRLQEQLAQFDNWVKSFGFVFKNREGSWREYHDGLNFTENFEHQIQKRIVETLLNTQGEEFINSVRKTLKNYISKHQDLPGSVLNSLEKCLDPSNNDLATLILFDPWFVFNNLLSTNKHILYYEYFSQSEGYERIVDRTNKSAEIVMPPIYRGQFKIGNRDIIDIDFEFFKKAPTFYRIQNESVVDSENKRIDVDLVCRTFNGAYNIVVASDSSDLSKYGKVQENVKFDGEYRLNPRSHQQMYKLDKNSNYQIRVDNKGVETIIFFDQPGVYQSIIDLINSDKSLVTVQAFLTNILWQNSNVDELSELIDACKRLDSLSIFTDSFNRLDFYLNKIESVNNVIELRDEYNKLTSDLYDLYIESEGKYKQRYAKASFVSFIRSLDVIATRIPTQNMSSIMPMKIAAFTDSDINNVFVTKWQQWLQGSDYDIDKAFILGYNFDDNGRFITWSPLQKMYDPELFEVSLRIPLPTGKVLTENPQNYDKSYPIIYDQNTEDVLMNTYIQDYIDLRNGNLSIEKIQLYANAFNVKLPEDINIHSDIIETLLLSQILFKLEETREMRIATEFKSDNQFKYLVKTLNKHLKFIPDPEGEKNQTTWLTHQIMSSPKYSVTTYKSIDVATEAFTDPLSKISSSTYYNIDDGHTNSSITVSGATGKDDVGIGANGTKVYFTELSYFNNYFQNNSIPIIRIFNSNDVENSDAIKANPHFDLSAFKFEYTDSKTGEQVESKTYVIGPISDTILTPIQKEFYEEEARREFGEEFYLYDRDAAQDVGALLSLAADNAKSLSLDKLNATTDYFAMHIYLASMGIPPKTIIGFFRSKEFTKVIDRAMNDLLQGDENRGVDILSLSVDDFDLEESEKERFGRFLLTLQSIYRGAKEMTSLSRILSSNQGIKIETRELNTIKRNTERVFNEAFADRKGWYFVEQDEDIPFNKNRDVIRLKIRQANMLLRAAGVTLQDKMNFERFLTDKLYQRAIIAAYDVVKEKINVFDVIVNAPHFLQILKSYNTLLKIYTSSSHYLDQLINKSEQQYNKDIVQIPYDGDQRALFKIPNYSSKSETAYKQAYDDILLSTFFTEIVSKRMSFEYDSHNSLQRLFGKDYTCDFSDNQQLYKFINFFNEVIYPMLLSKYGDMRIIRGLTFNEIARKESSDFILGFDKNIQMLQRKDNIGGSEFMLLQDEFDRLCSIPLKSLLDPENKGIFSIADDSLTIGDAMYCYFTLGKRIVPSIHSLSPLFSGLNKVDSLKFDFMKFVIDLDKHRRELIVSPNVFMAYVCKSAILSNSDIEEKIIRFESKFSPISYNLPKTSNSKDEPNRKTIFLSMKVNPNQLESFELAEIFRNCYLNKTLTINFNKDCD